MTRRSDTPFIIIDRRQVAIPSGSRAMVLKECDCACSISIPPAEPAVAVPLAMDSQVHRRAPALRSQPLDADHWALFNPECSAGVVAVNRAALALLDRFRRPTPLGQGLNGQDDKRGKARQALSRFIALDILQPVSRPPQPLPGDHLLTAWLHITNRCNFSCKYCYLPHNPADMSTVTSRAAVDAVIRSAIAGGYPAIKLKYAGGEPTLRMAQVFQAHDYAIARCQDRGIDLFAVLLTNGTRLTDTAIDGLEARDISVMVSLDGLGEGHNAQRPFINGSGSAERVTATIDRLVERGIRAHLSITISRLNCDLVADAVRFALERGLTFSLNFYRETDHSLSFPELRYDHQGLIRGMEAAFEAIEANLPAWSVVGTILDRGHLLSAHEFPCGAARNYLVIGPDGRIAKCQMELDKPVAHVHDPNPLENIRRAAAGTQNPSVLEKEGCRDCEWRLWCAGGCPLSTFRATGRYDVRSPNCDIYQPIFPQTVRLEGLRLLKYAA